MSRPVTLQSEDGAVIGNTCLKTNFPMQPKLLIWNGEIFVSAGIVYGVGSPGNYEIYRSYGAPETVEVVVPANVDPCG